MADQGPYTCADYRQEMILLGLKRQLADPQLSESQRDALVKKIRELEHQMGMD